MLTRRRVLASSLYLGGAAVLGCTSPPTSTEDAPTPGTDGGPGTDTGMAIDGGPGTWTVGGVLLVAGSDGTFDLRPTLPPGTPAGGTFDVDPSGAPLPAGMTLSADGILSVGTATAAVVDGVVFGYSTP